MKSEIPKVLHPMCGRTLLGHAIFAARGLAPDHIAVVVRHERDRVAAHAAECDPGITIADQDEIKGTGRALCAACAPFRRIFRGRSSLLRGTLLCFRPTFCLAFWDGTKAMRSRF